MSRHFKDGKILKKALKRALWKILI